MFEVQFIGSVPVAQMVGDDVVADALKRLRELDKAIKAAGKSKKALPVAELVENAGGVFPPEPIPALLLISAESIRAIDQHTREQIRNTIIRAVSFTTEVWTKKDRYFAFIDVDDRRQRKTCHFFECDKADKKLGTQISDTFYRACEVLQTEIKKRAGDPFAPGGLWAA